MSTSSAIHQVTIGPSFAALLAEIPPSSQADTRHSNPTSPSQHSPPSLFSFKYNFKPESASGSTTGALYNPSSHAESDWQLELDADPSGSRGLASPEKAAVNQRPGHVFSGPQHSSRTLDCVLVWDQATQSYQLDRLASTFDVRFERSKTTLSHPTLDVWKQSGQPRAKKRQRQIESRLHSKSNPFHPSTAAEQPSRSLSTTRASSVESRAVPKTNPNVTSPTFRGRSIQRGEKLSSNPASRFPLSIPVEELDDTTPASSRNHSNEGTVVSSREHSPTRPDSVYKGSTLGPRQNRPHALQHSSSFSSSKDEYQREKRDPPPETFSTPFTSTRTSRPHHGQELAPRTKDTKPPPSPEPVRATEELIDSFEDDLGAQLERELEQELERSQDLRDTMAKDSNQSSRSPTLPLVELETTSILASPAQESSRSSTSRTNLPSSLQTPSVPLEEAVAVRAHTQADSPSPVKFRLKKSMPRRYSSDNSVATVQQAQTPKAHTPSTEDRLSADSCQRPESTLGFVSPEIRVELQGHPEPFSKASVGLGLRSTGVGITPTTSPRIDIALRDKSTEPGSSTVNSPLANSINCQPRSYAIHSSGPDTASPVIWQPKPTPSQSASETNRIDSGYDEEEESDDGDQVSDADDDDGDEDEDEEDNGLDDFAAELDMTLAEATASNDEPNENSSVPVPFPTSHGRENIRTDKINSDTLIHATSAAAAVRQDKQAEAEHHDNDTDKSDQDAWKTRRQRKVYGLGGPREEEEDLEDSD